MYWPCIIIELVWWQVVGGTMNCGSGFLIIETSAVASESTIARMAQMVEQVSSCIGCYTD